MINLPFLKRRKGGGSQSPTADKMVGLSPDDQLDDQCIEEMMDACTNRDHGMFRSALEALIRNSFEHEESDGPE